MPVGRKPDERAWGGREPGVEAKAGADGSMGRTGAWGGREYGADGSVHGAEGAWAEGSMGRKGVWGARHTPTHCHAATNLLFDPQATKFLSPPGGICLIRVLKTPLVQSLRL